LTIRVQLRNNRGAIGVPTLPSQKSPIFMVSFSRTLFAAFAAGSCSRKGKSP
jgi:hypothetical protein